MKFDPLKFDDDDAFERAAAFIHDTQADKQVPDSARELMDSGISELRSALADLSDRDIARVLLVIGTLHGQLIDRSPGWSRVVIANLTLHIAAQMWRENTPGAAALFKDIADAAADSAAFTALERLHARIHRDFNFDASESAAPDDERWARVMDELVTFADQLYLPLADPTTTAEKGQTND